MFVVQVVPGETALAFYRAKNPTDKPITGISTYNVVPFEAGQYFNKIQVVQQVLRHGSLHLSCVLGDKRTFLSSLHSVSALRSSAWTLTRRWTCPSSSTSTRSSTRTPGCPEWTPSLCPTPSSRPRRVRSCLCPDTATTDPAHRVDRPDAGPDSLPYHLWKPWNSSVQLSVIKKSWKKMIDLWKVIKNSFVLESWMKPAVEAPREEDWVRRVFLRFRRCWTDDKWNSVDVTSEQRRRRNVELLLFVSALMSERLY